MAFAAACFGFLSSLAWALLNRASKYWQEAWEQKLRLVEHEVLGAELFSNEEPLMEKRVTWLAAARYSPSKLVIALSYITLVSWAGLVFIHRMYLPVIERTQRKSA